MTPLEKAQQEQNGGSPVKTAAKIAAGLGLVAGGVYTRGLFKRGFNKANAGDFTGTFKAGVGALKDDASKAGDFVSTIPERIKKARAGFNLTTPMKQALPPPREFTAHAHRRLVELNAATDKVVQFEKGADGRFVAVKKQEEKPGMSTGAKVAAGATVAGLIGAGAVAARGGQYLGSRGAYKGGFTADNVKRTFRVGKNLIKGDADTVVRKVRSAVNAVTK